jgi:hypothetical protein
MTERRISRRDFAFKIAPALITAGFMAACERAKEAQMHRIEGGETADLTYFRLCNDLPSSYMAYINEPVLEERTEKFGVPLRSSRTLEIDLLPRTKFEGAGVPDFEFVRVEVSPLLSRVEIAVGEFIKQITEFEKKPPMDCEDETNLSIMTSGAIFLGHCEVAHQKGEMTREDVFEKTVSYVESILNNEQPYVISWIAIEGSVPPEYFQNA